MIGLGYHGMITGMTRMPGQLSRAQGHGTILGNLRLEDSDHWHGIPGGDRDNSLNSSCRGPGRRRAETVTQAGTDGCQELEANSLQLDGRVGRLGPPSSGRGRRRPVGDAPTVT
jgi:hypothetical protein